MSDKYPVGTVLNYTNEEGSINGVVFGVLPSGETIVFWESMQKIPYDEWFIDEHFTVVSQENITAIRQ